MILWKRAAAGLLLSSMLLCGCGEKATTEPAQKDKNEADMKKSMEDMTKGLPQDPSTTKPGSAPTGK